ncbi:hypothetical protein PROFUN_03093 [Planoprotostelium fungivorum]|uniref:Uncharacterized protein n=1 Tax=Planoprotostelium fungivorum TaxID=1890364 RepID=A0A2P6NQ69_9EUKA|nr:hypothetical protein PROFUN_03093 [Planoprotostelium fungivorum]
MTTTIETNFPIPRQPIQGWHEGEIALQKTMGWHDQVPDATRIIRSDLPQQHRIFHHSNICFLPLTVLAADGRLWTGILSSDAGTSGFISSPTPDSITGQVQLWKGDPLEDHMRDNGLCAGVGVEYHTRRRNKLAGTIERVHRDGNTTQFHISINEATGHKPLLDINETLTDPIIDFIGRQSTVYLGTAALRREGEHQLGHLGCNHRGGCRGFVRVRRDRRTLVVPDYSGNRFMSSLGNIQVTPLASLTFVDFETGDVLYVSGTARNVTGAEAAAIMPRTPLLTLVYIAGYTLVRDALPFRSIVDVEDSGKSLYSPPLRYLNEEKETSLLGGGNHARLVGVRFFGDSEEDPIATFEFEYSERVFCRGGQYVVIDMSPLSGSRGYRHMAEHQPRLVNDDGIRTWTVSFHSNETFCITIKRVPNGIVTPLLFSIGQLYGNLRDSSVADVRLPVLGFGGDFILPPPERKTKFLWIAGGIGITPFLSFLNSIDHDVDVMFVIVTREPQITLDLIDDALPITNDIKLCIKLYSTNRNPVIIPGRCKERDLDVNIERRRWKKEDVTSWRDVKERMAYVCGPIGLEEDVVDALTSAGVEKENIIRETFNY